MDNYGEGLLGRIAMLEDDLHAMTQARDDALRYCETIQADADKARMKTNYCTSCKGYADRIAALTAAGDRLNGYAGHDEQCKAVKAVWPNPKPSNCGYYEARQGWRQAKGEG